jgi:hypothetical protein
MAYANEIDRLIRVLVENTVVIESHSADGKKCVGVSGQNPAQILQFNCRGRHWPFFSENVPAQ